MRIAIWIACMAPMTLMMAWLGVPWSRAFWRFVGVL